MRRRPRPVAAEIEKYLGTDLLFYRAAEPDGLVASQRAHWDPMVEWARETLGARFVLAEGVIHAPQPEAAIAAAAAAIPNGADIKECLAARRAQCRHHADRLGAAGAGARGGPAHHRRGLGRGACRRGLADAVLGPRRGGAGSAAPIASPRCRRRRRVLDALALDFVRAGAGVLRIELGRALEARLGLFAASHRLEHQAPAGMRRREFGVALDRLVEACQRLVEPAQRLQRQPAVAMRRRQAPG